MLKLDGKIALVMGAGSIGDGWGNGKATAALPARQGAKAFGTDTRLEVVEARYVTGTEIVVDGGLTAAGMG
jgi:NAD(P)-dependent dehydrogenase (short-subunit alcohol dehydrogenase family)